jgi:opacity protein-like surface antigen
MLKKIRLFLPLLFVCAVASAADKDPVYVGAELGYARTTFVPNYRTANGDPEGAYTDQADGAVFRLLAGYRLQLSGRFALSMQGHFGFAGATWDLDTTEPAHLEYKIPRMYGVSLLPAVRVAHRVSLCGEIGFERGYVQEQKTSPVSSSYDFSKWTSGYAVGGGAIYDLNRRVNVSLLYRHISYAWISYTSHLPDGTLWEIVRDKPTISSVNVGVSYRF